MRKTAHVGMNSTHDLLATDQLWRYENDWTNDGLTAKAYKKHLRNILLVTASTTNTRVTPMLCRNLNPSEE